MPDSAEAALRKQLGDRILGPDGDAYGEAMLGIFFSDAALSHPCCIVQPRSAADVAVTLQTATAEGVPVTVRGGGLSASCAADGAVLLDLSANMNTGELIGDMAKIGGGATMGTLLATLDPIGGTVPIGIATVPGFGLATRGGIGYLTRSRGLTVDFLEAAEIVVPSGDVLHLSDSSTGEEADLWWAVRGCAPHFGIVTSATYRSFPRPSVFVHRLVLPLEAAAAYFELAPSLPRETSISAVLSRPLGAAGEPVLFLITVYAGDDADGIEQARASARQVADGSPPLFEAEGTYPYMLGMPEMAVPGLDGTEPPAVSYPVPGESRLYLFSKCPFLRPTLDVAAAEGLAECIRLAPTPLCRIDLQHTGGALADVPVDDTSFWGRDAEWNNPLNAMWIDNLVDRESCMAWARETVAVLEPYSAGYYSVEVRPGLPETRREVELSFGEHLPRLRELWMKWDPDELLVRNFPL